jgi:hypothetical protein
VVRGKSGIRRDCGRIVFGPSSVYYEYVGACRDVKRALIWMCAMIDRFDVRMCTGESAGYAWKDFQIIGKQMEI